MSLKNGDLKGMILPMVSIDEFQPKAGEDTEVIVVAFYLMDQDPADDLNTFIQRGVIDSLDVEVSPNTDDEGRYLVFVEMSRDDTFPNKFQALLKDVENVSGPMEWKVKTYLSDDQEFDFNDPEIYKFIITNPDEYMSKDEFMKESMQTNVESFLQESHIMYIKFDNTTNHVTMGRGDKAIIAEVVDVGDYDTVIGRNFLAESAFRLTNRPIEATVLTGMLGVYEVMPIDKFLCVGKDDKVMLLKNTEIKYRG
jgi:hypothetical protein